MGEQVLSRYIKQTWCYHTQIQTHPFFKDKFLIGYCSVLDEPLETTKEFNLQQLEYKEKTFKELVRCKSIDVTLLQIAFSLYLFCGEGYFKKLPLYYALVDSRKLESTIKNELRTCLKNPVFKLSNRLYSAFWANLRQKELNLIDNL